MLSVARLIQEYGVHLTNIKCGLCGSKTLYQIGPHPSGFIACSKCDTTPASGKEVAFK